MAEWRRFEAKEIFEAYKHCDAGGIAVHVCSAALVGPSAPRVFKGRQFAHLMGPDRETLIAAAKSLGCKVSWIQRDDDDRRRHFDITGSKLREALKRCK